MATGSATTTTKTRPAESALESQVSLYPILSVNFVGTLGFGIILPCLLSLISQSIDKKFQGAIQGYTSSLGSAASIIGLLAGGILYDRIGAGVFVCAAAIIFVIFLMALNTRKKPDDQDHQTNCSI
jgi:MFS family permease